MLTHNQLAIIPQVINGVVLKFINFCGDSFERAVELTNETIQYWQHYFIELLIQVTQLYSVNLTFQN